MTDTYKERATMAETIIATSELESLKLTSWTDLENYGEEFCKAFNAGVQACIEVLGAGWLPIESAPKDGTEILLLRRDVGRQLMCVGKWAANFHGSGWYRDKGWMMTGYQGLAHDAVSPPPELWTPLPPSPESKP
jgi:hypothetical protein